MTISCSVSDDKRKIAIKAVRNNGKHYKKNVVGTDSLKRKLG